MKLVLYGDSSYAELIKYYFESDSEYEVVGFCVDKKFRNKKELCGLPVVDFEEVDEIFSKSDHHLFCAIGYKSMRAKKMIYEKAKATGYRLASYISKDAIYDSSNKIGDNCMLLPGVILEPYASIGSNTFLNTGVTVCHHSRIDSHCFLAARSLVGGYTSVGENSFIGFHATVLQQLTLAAETLVGANSTLMQDTKKSTLYAGSPAREIRTHAERGIEIL